MISAANLPANPNAERALLGACIMSPDALGLALDSLHPADFADTRHRLIFEAITALYQNEQPIDFVTLPIELSKNDTFGRIGGQAYLDNLLSDAGIAANVEAHAKIVRDCAIRRKLIMAAERIQSLAMNKDTPIADVLEEAEKLIFDAALNKTSSDFYHVSEILGSVFSTIEERYTNPATSRDTGYLTGFRDLDHLTGGLQPGSFTIIAARPSMGKTALALNMAQCGGNGDNKPVLIFSVEMPKEQLAQRMIAAHSGISLSEIMRGTFDTKSFEIVKKTCSYLAGRNIFINDDPITAIDFRTRCRRFKTRHPDLALVVVDYLQLMTSGKDRDSQNRQIEVSDISRMLKATAREIKCPVIALSQLSRAAEQRPDKKPQLSDLRDSGAIEQDADVVMMLYREDYYSDNENNDLTDSKADVRIAKNRNGSTGVCSLTFRREITRFYNFGEEDLR